MKKRFNVLTVCLLVICMMLSTSLTVFADTCMNKDTVNIQKAAELFVEELQDESNEDLEKAEELAEDVNPYYIKLDDWTNILEATIDELDGNKRQKSKIIVNAANDAIETLVNQAKEQSKYTKNDIILARSLEYTCNTYAVAVKLVCRDLGVDVQCKYDIVSIGSSFALIDPLFIRR